MQSAYENEPYMQKHLQYKYYSTSYLFNVTGTTGCLACHRSGGLFPLSYCLLGSPFGCIGKRPGLQVGLYSSGETLGLYVEGWS